MQDGLLKNIIKTYENELKSLEDNLNDDFTLEHSSLSDISKYQIQTGGKRIRPLLVFIIAKLISNEVNQDTINFATCVELIHNATLIHDDIIDNSKLRRQKETVTKKYGTNKAILSGDFLFAYALKYALNFPKNVIEKIRDTLINLILGESKELDYDLKRISVNDCLKIIQNKTSSLFSLSTLGSYFINSKNNEDINESYNWRYESLGQNIGTCFQIMDDILDTFSDEKSLGKEAGTDFIEKKPSLIVTLWLNKNTPLKDKYLNLEKITKEDFQDIRKEIQNLNIIDEAREIFNDYYDKACEDMNIAIKDYSNNSSMLDLQNYIFYIKSKIMDF